MVRIQASSLMLVVWTYFDQVACDTSGGRRSRRTGCGIGRLPKATQHRCFQTVRGGFRWSGCRGALSSAVSFAVCLRNFADFRPCLRREDAVAYCESLGARLPHEWEWQYAAQGNDGRPWPWGAIGDNDTVGYTHRPNVSHATTMPPPAAVDAYPTGVSPL